jgi:hypothetical protein
MGRPLPTPRTPADVTAGWLTQALRQSGTLSRGAVSEARVEPLGMQGYLSGVARVILTYDTPRTDAPRTVVVKLPSVAEENRAIGESLRAYQREALFYLHIAPDTDIRIPRCYHASADPNVGDWSLLLEDCSNLRNGNQIEGLTYDEAIAALRTIARLHAPWWNSPRLDALDWMPRENLALLTRFHDDWPGFRDEYARRIGREAVAVGEKIAASGAAIERLTATAPHTITHWDYRADNVLLDDANAAEPIVVLDWQLAIRQLGAFDIARAITGSLPILVGEHHLRELVGVWHEELVARGVPNFSTDDAWLHYRLGLLQLLYTPVAFHHVLSHEAGRSQELLRVIIERQFHSAIETDACGILP